MISLATHTDLECKPVLLEAIINNNYATWKIVVRILLVHIKRKVCHLEFIDELLDENSYFITITNCNKRMGSYSMNFNRTT